MSGVEADCWVDLKARLAQAFDAAKESDARRVSALAPINDDIGPGPDEPGAA